MKGNRKVLFMFTQSPHLLYRVCNGFIAGLLMLVAGCSPHDKSHTLFEDVTLGSGLDIYTGMSYGAAWGDYNGDGFPDLYVTNHLNTAQLFANKGHGHFEDTTLDAFAARDIGGDKHGAAWADFNNDGQLDLVQLTGAVVGIGSEPKKLFINRGSRFDNIAKVVGVANVYGRTRMPLWLDIDNNGQLDLFHGAEARFDNRAPPFIFLQKDKGFTPVAEQITFPHRSVPFCILSELNGDKRPELLCRVVGKNQTVQIFDLSALPAKTLDLLPVTAFEDIAAGDFDNDGAIDLFLARKNAAGRVAFGQPGSNGFIADISTRKPDFNTPAGFSFETKGKITFVIKAMHPKTLKPTQIAIGENALQPSTLAFSISQETAGMKATTETNTNIDPARAITIRNIEGDRWQVTVAGKFDAADKSQFQQLTFKINSDSPISNIKTLNDASRPEEAPTRLFMNRNDQLIEESEKRGVNKRLIAATNVVSADFDNDMDLDLFVVTSGEIGKQENLLLINDGEGYFEPATAAGGAAGNHHGVGDSITTVDFDQDGFLDIFVASGFSMGRSLGLASDAGAYSLYHNRTNSNHWVTLNLEGVKSNRDGIGAVVTLTTGGITQTRVQDGGIHHRGQNDQQLHFGLGQHEQADDITIYWPSGTVQVLNAIEADQHLLIKEQTL